MMSSYKALLEQREKLEAQIREARAAELADAVAKVRAIVGEYGLTAEDVFPPARRTAGSGSVAPKYRDPESGQTWTGRGKAPTWIRDKNRDDFLIPA